MSRLSKALFFQISAEGSNYSVSSAKSSDWQKRNLKSLATVGEAAAIVENSYSC